MNIKIALEIALELFNVGRKMYSAYTNAQTEKEKQKLAAALKSHDLEKINEILRK